MDLIAQIEDVATRTQREGLVHIRLLLRRRLRINAHDVHRFVNRVAQLLSSSPFRRGNREFAEGRLTEFVEKLHAVVEIGGIAMRGNKIGFRVGKPDVVLVESRFRRQTRFRVLQTIQNVLTLLDSVVGGRIDKKKNKLRAANIPIEVRFKEIGGYRRRVD